MAALALAGVLACDSGTGPDEDTGTRLRVDTDQVQMGDDRSASFTVENVGSVSVGSIRVETTFIADPDGHPVDHAFLVSSPAEVTGLDSGASATVELALELPGILEPGVYRTSVTLVSEAGEIVIPVSFVVREVSADEVASIEFLDPPTTAVQGTVARLPLRATDEEGDPLEGAPVVWTTAPADAGLSDGERFVAYDTGTIEVIASAGTVADTATLTVSARSLTGSMELRAVAPVPGRATSDLWVHGSHAYTGTWGQPAGFSDPGNALFAWDVGDPANPVLTDSLIVNARVVNDVKVSPDGTFGVLSHESSSDGANGISLLDLSDPAHPSVITRYTAGLHEGVHNIWLENDYAYVVVAHGSEGLKILDVSDPAAPSEVAEYYGGSSIIHDVYVRDGLAFVSHWDRGLVILDVGGGGAGGSPDNPVVLSQTVALGGDTHNAWYWPEAGYAFVGEEDVGAPGIVRVLDVRDPTAPELVATFGVPGNTPHNFWVDEENAVLYAAWYSNGVRAVDVSGELLGDLARQGREIDAALYGAEDGWCATAASAPACSWAPQLHDGSVFVSDMREGLVVLSPAR